jgi:hypothetical protein
MKNYKLRRNNMTNKSRLVLQTTLIIITLTLALTGCGNGSTGTDSPAAAENRTVRSSGTTKTLSLGTDCNVTVKSADKFTDAEWNTLCGKVSAAIEKEYGRCSDDVTKQKFECMFASEENTTVVLSKSASCKCEVKAGDNTIYLNTNAIDTVDFQSAVLALDANGENQQN